jgi:hypothetical protein
MGDETATGAGQPELGGDHEAFADSSAGILAMVAF